MMKGNNDRQLRAKILESLYDLYREQGLYRGVISLKVLAEKLDTDSHTLERNMEYLLERKLVSMHKIDDLVSISTSGIDEVELSEKNDNNTEILLSLKRIEEILQSIEKKV